MMLYDDLHVNCGQRYAIRYYLSSNLQLLNRNIPRVRSFALYKFSWIKSRFGSSEIYFSELQLSSCTQTAVQNIEKYNNLHLYNL